MQSYFTIWTVLKLGSSSIFSCHPSYFTAINTLKVRCVIIRSQPSLLVHVLLPIKVIKSLVCKQSQSLWYETPAHLPGQKISILHIFCLNVLTALFPYTRAPAFEKANCGRNKTSQLKSLSILTTFAMIDWSYSLFFSPIIFLHFSFRSYALGSLNTKRTVIGFVGN